MCLPLRIQFVSRKQLAITQTTLSPFLRRTSTRFEPRVDVTWAMSSMRMSDGSETLQFLRPISVLNRPANCHGVPDCAPRSPS